MADDAMNPTYEPLTDHEALFTEFIFDIRDPANGESYVHLKLFGTERLFATQFELCSLKPRIWILDTILNLVAVQMTNAERLQYPDKRHLMWYLPVTVSRHILDNPNMTDCDVKKLCDCYFGDTNFTGDIRSCSMIYVPTNDRGSHWFCIKIDIGIRMAYIFYSKPASRSNSYRKKLTRALLEGLHRALVFQYGDLYQFDVTKFNIANVQRQPMQQDTDGYDCGLFVIKFMQGFNYSSGVHTMDDTERPRLLLELCGDENNRDALQVMNKFEAWKAGRELIVQRNCKVTLLIHFGGKLVETPFSYIGGQVGQCMPISGRMSYYELRAIINEIGCSNLVRLVYQVTATDGEIRLLLIDGDVALAEMFALYGREAQIHIYLDDPLWSDDSESERGIPNISAQHTTGQGRRRGGQNTTARGRGRGRGRVGGTGRGGGMGATVAI